MSNYKYTVAQLAGDLSLLDITGHVRKDPDFRNPIACGQTGEVHRGFLDWIDPGSLQVYSQKVVIKTLKGEPQEQSKIEERVLREVATWRQLNHPNVCQFLGIAYMHPKRAPSLVSQFLQRNDFLAYVARHPELKLVKAREVALGLQYLHSNNVVHGDLHTSNILVSNEGVARLNDFGMSKMADTKGFTTKLLLNIRYNAPELMPIQDIDMKVEPTSRSDIFSLAMLILQVLNAKPNQDLQKQLPYNHIRLSTKTTYESRLLRLIHKGERPQRTSYDPMWDHHWDLLCRCWHGDEYLRPNVHDVVANI